jgi:hypothetical protein
MYNYVCLRLAVVEFDSHFNIISYVLEHFIQYIVKISVQIKLT